MTIPQYLLASLCEYLPAIEALDQRRAIVAASVPHYKPSDQRATWRQLNALIAQLEPRQSIEPMEKIEIDREKAAAWFAEQGYRLVKAS